MFLHFDFYVTAAGTRRPCARVFAVWKDNKYCFEIVYSHQQEFHPPAIVLPACENLCKSKIGDDSSYEEEDETMRRRRRRRKRKRRRGRKENLVKKRRIRSFRISDDRIYIKIKINDHSRKKDRNILFFFTNNPTYFYYLYPHLSRREVARERLGRWNPWRVIGVPIRYHRLANRPVTR